MKATGMSARQIARMIVLGCDNLITPKRGTNVLSSGALAALFHPGANLSRENLPKLRAALGLGEAQQLVCNSPNLDNVASLVKLIEDRGKIVTSMAQTVIESNAGSISVNTNNTYRTWIVRCDNLSGGGVGMAATTMGLMLPPLELGLLLRLHYTQAELGPDEIIIISRDMMEFKRGEVKDYYYFLLKKGAKGEDVLDVFPLNSHGETHFVSSQHFAFVNSYGPFASLPEREEE